MATPVTVDGVEGVRSLVGRELGPTEWVEITQEMVDHFADATGDHQWIHVDVERATRESPFGRPVAHGYLTLSLWPRFAPEILHYTGFALTLNYGAEKVRFPSPVPVGARLRARVVIESVSDVAEGVVQTVQTATFEVEGATKPACVAAIVLRHYV